MNVFMQTAVLKATIFLLWCLASLVHHAKEREGWDSAKEYLYQFFLTEKEPSLIAQKEQTKFLQQTGHNETGLLHEKLLGVLSQRRCGVPDEDHHSLKPGSSRWNKSNLTYSIINFPYGMKPSTVSVIIHNAISVWSKVTPLIFQQVASQDADIKFSFWKRAHGDCWSFDGPGGILGHAFLPDSQHPGTVHFDKDEHWSTSNKGSNLFLVAVHEIGHSLGLKHSENAKSVMYPIYYYQNPKKFHLGAEDIRRIQQLYGLYQLVERGPGE